MKLSAENLTTTSGYSVEYEFIWNTQELEIVYNGLFYIRFVKVCPILCDESRLSVLDLVQTPQVRNYIEICTTYMNYCRLWHSLSLEY